MMKTRVRRTLLLCFAGLTVLFLTWADPTQSADWLRAKYGGWGGPGVRPAPGPMDSLLVKDYAPKSSVVARETMVAKARFPAIDVHAHSNAKTAEEVKAWVKTMDEVGVETTIILTGATGEQFDKLADLYLKAYPNRFQLYCGLNTTDIDKPDYAERAVAELVRCYKKGARGVGELTDKGTGLSRDAGLPAAKRLHPDDARLDAFWDKCAELKIPVVAHIADHPSSWKPLDVFQERTPDFQHFNLYGKDVSSYEELIAIRNRMLSRHPKTTYIACHLGNQGHDLALLAKELEAHPNLYLDISARDYEVGRTPRPALKFLTKYRSRVLFGTDMGREKSMYQSWWRLFESADEFMPGRVWWRYSGLDLPASSLQSIYRKNALNVLNWEKM
jgi:predicted TIM-barrel fold metal-dependent hydrolase